MKKIALFFSALVLTGCKLEVLVAGDGAGKITSRNNSISCGVDSTKCKTTMMNSVTLTATPTEDSRFVGWSGDCSGSDPVCVVSPKKPARVTAKFESDRPQELNCGTEGAKAECLTPKFPPEYYIDQSVKYFLTMDSATSIFVQPNYSDEVIRWEWAPWLILTGYTRFNLIWTDILLKLHPTKYDFIDCRFFETQPFGRCRVMFDYSGEKCPIYEEFTFNDKGEMTFIEAWSDYPSLLPMLDPTDEWAERENTRLANRVPGLGNEKGLIAKNGESFVQASKIDSDVFDLRRRLNIPYKAYFEELASNYDAVAKGCRPPQ